VSAHTAGELAWAAAAIFIAYLCRGVSGFGAGLIATPLLAFAFPMQVIVPLNTLLVSIVFVFVTIRDRREVVWEELKPLIVPTFVGVAAGLFVFKSLENHVLLMLLGGFLVIYALYVMAVHVWGLPQLTCSRAWAFPAGALGAFIDMMFGGGGGPVVVVYMHARGITKLGFRATVATLWLLEMVARLTAYTSVGYYTADVLLLVACLLPFVAAGTWAGERLGNRIRHETFSKILALMLLVNGVSLLVR
jgi:uncharacterized membrane protein YfcA